MENEINKLIKRYGYNSPVFTEEILAAWNGYSRPWIFRLLKEAVKSGLLKKYSYGVYYIPLPVSLGGASALSPRAVMEKRYIRFNGAVYGYYSGLALLNGLGLSAKA
ncbi:MAG: hypothetical protein LBP26_05220, partial [Clostridiales bacterium]|nr:hypothetical protein [Clostridiales bacterium]